MTVQQNKFVEKKFFEKYLLAEKKGLEAHA
jgi:hypothetical protein